MQNYQTTIDQHRIEQKWQNMWSHFIQYPWISLQLQTAIILTTRYEWIPWWLVKNVKRKIICHKVWIPQSNNKWFPHVTVLWSPIQMNSSEIYLFSNPSTVDNERMNFWWICTYHINYVKLKLSEQSAPWNCRVVLQ